MSDPTILITQHEKKTLSGFQSQNLMIKVESGSTVTYDTKDNSLTVTDIQHRVRVLEDIDSFSLMGSR